MSTSPPATGAIPDDGKQPDSRPSLRKPRLAQTLCKLRTIFWLAKWQHIFKMGSAQRRIDLM
jgi:hypothetical protein